MPTTELKLAVKRVPHLKDRNCVVYPLPFPVPTAGTLRADTQRRTTVSEQQGQRNFGGNVLLDQLGARRPQYS
jgi:hypothetical protein